MKPNIAYVIQATDETLAVKVGYSGNPVNRFNSIRVSVPFNIRLVGLLGNGRDAENHMKQLLSKWQLRGEWFEPRPELNDFLAKQRELGHIIEQVEVTAEYSDRFIRPAIEAYLNGRAPTLSEPGDLVARFLHEGASAIKGRADKLSSAVLGNVSAEILSGYVSVGPDVPTPQITLKPSVSVRAVEAA